MNIYALSSGPGVSGIAVVRVSGIHTKKIISSITNGEMPPPRVATLKKFNALFSSTLHVQVLLKMPLKNFSFSVRRKQ